MEIDFIGYNWEVCDKKETNFSNLPTTDCVYLLLIKAPVFGGRKLIYIGATKNLRSRMCSHEVLNILRWNKAKYDIEILFRNWGRNINSKIESQLIKEYNPPYNMSLKVYSKYSIWDMWDDLRIKKVKRKKKAKGDYDFWEVKKQKNLFIKNTGKSVFL